MNRINCISSEVVKIIESRTQSLNKPCPKIVINSDDDHRGSTLHLRGKATVIAGRPRTGKHTLVTHMLCNWIISDQGPILYFSLDTPKDEIILHLAASLLNKNIRISKEGFIEGISENDLDNLNKHTSFDVYIDDTPFASYEYVIQQFRTLLATGATPALIVLDSLSKIRLEDPSRAQVIMRYHAHYLKELKRVINQSDCHLIIIEDIDKKVEERNNHRPRLTDMSHCPAIEAIADNTVLLYREGFYSERTKDRDKVEIHVETRYRSGSYVCYLKNRHFLF